MTNTDKEEIVIGNRFVNMRLVADYQIRFSGLIGYISRLVKVFIE